MHIDVIAVYKHFKLDIPKDNILENSMYIINWNKKQNILLKY